MRRSPLASTVLVGGFLLLSVAIPQGSAGAEAPDTPGLVRIARTASGAVQRAASACAAGGRALAGRVVEAVPGLGATLAASLSDANSDGVASPGETIAYVATVSNAGSDAVNDVAVALGLDPSTTLVAGSAKTGPLVADEAYATTGNLTLSVDAASGLLANDSDPDGTLPAAPVTAATDQATAQGGAVTIAADGSFSYAPAAGFEGTDTFTYTVTDTDGIATSGTATVVVTDPVWFVDASAAAGGDGTEAAPFQSLASLNGAGGSGDVDTDDDVIYLAAGTYTGGLVLEAGQRLVGEGVALVVGAATLKAAGSAPTLKGTAAAPAVTLASGNTVEGLALGNDAGTGVSGSNVGTFTFRSGSVAVTGGPAFDVATGTLDVTAASVSSTTSAAEGIDLDNVAGTFSVTGTASVTNSAGRAVDLAGGTATVSFGQLTIANGTSNQTGLFASNTGTVNVTAGTIDAGTASAVDIDNAALAVVLTSVRSVGGSAPGLDLQTTTGSFAVVGDGASTAQGGNGSGGTIASKSSFDGDTGGNGVYLSNVQNVVLRRMQLNDFQNHAVYGTAVTGFGLDYSTVSGTNGTSAGDDEGSVRFVGLYGSATITGSKISGGLENNVRVANTSGTLDRLTVSGTEIGLTNGYGGADGLLLDASGSAVAHLTVSSSSFLGARDDLLQVSGNPGTTVDVVLTGNQFHNTQSYTSGGGVDVGGGGFGASYALTYYIEGNTFRGANEQSLTVTKASGTGTVQGIIDNNTFGVSGSTGSGAGQYSSALALLSYGTGSHTTSITNNTLRQYGESGIYLRSGDGSAALDATVTGNTTSEPGSDALYGFYAVAGIAFSDYDVACLDVSGNDFTAGSPAFGFADLGVEQQNGSTVRLPGYAGGAFDTGAVASYLVARNTGTPSTDIRDDNFGGGFQTTTACATPSVAAPRIASAPLLPVEAPPAIPEAAETAVAPEPSPIAASPIASAPAARVAAETVSIGTMPAGSRVTVQFSALVGAVVRDETLSATVTASGTCADDATSTAATVPGRLAREIAGTAGWRMLAAPAAGLTVANVAGQNLVQGVDGYYPSFQTNLYTAYDGTSWAPAAGGTEALAPGKGFIWYLFDNDNDPGGASTGHAFPFVLSAPGAEPTGPVDVALHAAGDGWNLVGNPYGEAIDVSGLGGWDSGAGGTDLASYVGQIWDPAAGATGSYVTTTTNGDRVEAWQGVFVQNQTGAAGASTLSIPAEARSTGGTFYRRSAAPGLLAFELRGVAAGTSAETVDRAAVVYLHPDAEAGWDVWDAEKLEPLASAYATVAFGGTGADGAPVLKAQASVPEAGGLELPLHVDAVGVEGELELAWPRLERVPEAWLLLLHDHATGATVDLRTAESYRFSIGEGAAPGRSAVALPGRTLGPDGPPRFTLALGTAAVATPAGPPAATALRGALPNPAASSARVAFDLATSARVRLSVVDLLGREVAVLADGARPAGAHAVPWATERLAPGPYLLRLVVAADGAAEAFTTKATIAR